MSKTRNIHYVLSTHWDREWYQPFQYYRHRLVHLIDDILKGIESDKLKGPFTTDGQAIILEDYLEIRPEKRELIKELVSGGKWIVGPWYVLPDEFLVSGESIIRNIRLGRNTAREFGGKPSDAGFVCDLFGHCSQMPQLMKGFGIKAGFLWRGINLFDKRQLKWKGADGTVLPCFKFGRFGYCDFAYSIRKGFQPDHEFDEEDVLKNWEEYLGDEGKKNQVDPILIFDGGDHLECDWDVYHAIFNKEVDGYTLEHSSLDGYIDEMLQQVDRIDHEVSGELREPGSDPGDQCTQWLIPGVASSRVWIKQLNQQCQTLLCHWAEPFSVIAESLIEKEYPNGFLDVAWKWLLKNHPHDSICGCSVDQVHEDMKFRFSQCLQIAERLTSESLKNITASIDTQIDEDNLRVTVFNPQPYARDEIVELELEIPKDWPQFNEFFGFEPKPGFLLFDKNGNEIPYQRIKQLKEQVRTRISDLKFPSAHVVNVVTVALQLKLPAMGYTTLTLSKGKETPSSEKLGDALPIASRYSDTPKMIQGTNRVENEFFNIEIQPNGSINLTDKRTGKTFENLLLFEDCADIGDGWYHGAAVNDQFYHSGSSAAAVSIDSNGPLVARITIRTTLQVPESFDFNKMQRVANLVDLEIESKLTIRANRDHIDIETTLINTAEDHRLRVMLPTNLNVDTYWADSVFDAIKRPIALRDDNHTYRELDVETKPQQSWTAIHDSKCGLAVVTHGLMETAVCDTPQRPIALTLFRSTRRTYLTNGEPEGLLKNHQLNFKYRIKPLTEKFSPTKLTQQGQELGAGVKSVQINPRDLKQYKTESKLPSEYSALNISGNVCFSSLKQTNQKSELRVFNIEESEQKAGLSFSDKLKPQSLVEVDFESNETGETIQSTGSDLQIDVAAKKIKTYRWKD